MGTISSVGGNRAGAWADAAAARDAAMSSRLFSKVDSDGSGSVDKSELQGMLDHIADKTGRPVADADTLLTKMDSDGSGGLSADELSAGLKGLLAPPSSTVEFAQQRDRAAGGDGSGADATRMPPPPGPPPGAGPGGAGPSGSAGSSTSTDPLDTDGDGTVSAQERAAGEMKDLLGQLMTALDSNGDQSVSKSEVSDFLSKLNDAVTASSATSSAAGDDASTGSGAAPADAHAERALAALTALVRGEYGRHDTAEAADHKPKVDVAA